MLKVTRSIAIGCLLCCAAKTTILLAGGGALLTASTFATPDGAIKSILFGISFGLLGMAFHSMQKRGSCDVKINHRAS